MEAVRHTKSRSGHTHRIEMKLTEINQLFDVMDPSPFTGKDLDQDAEAFIVSWAQEFPPQDAVMLRIHLERWPPEDPKAMVTEAVHNYFHYKLDLNDLEFRRMMKLARQSLMIGVIFLVGCLLVSKVFLAHEEQAWASFLKESLSIIGWVAMWRPLQMYLYDWWPIRQRSRIYEKLSRMHVEIVGLDPLARTKSQLK